MFCCYFLFFLFYIYDHLEQRDLRNYKTNLHQIFRGGRHGGVDIQSKIGFAISQGTLPWQPILGPKLATRLPFWDSHSTTDGRMGKQMGALTAQKSCLQHIKFRELWSTNSGVYGDGLATIYAPNVWNRWNTFDSWDSHSTTDGRNRWTDLCQIRTEDVFGPSLGQVWMSKLKVKGQGHQGQKRAVHSQHPTVWTEWNALIAHNFT